MALNIQIQRYASTRPVKVLLGAVSMLLIFFAINIANTLAMPGSVLTRLEASVTPSNLSPNPAAILLYDNNGNAWQGSIFNPPGNSGVSSNHGFKHILKNEATSNVRKTTLNVYYDNEADARNDSFIIKQDYCNFSATNGNPPAGNNSIPGYPGANDRRHVADFEVNDIQVVGSGGTAFRNAATPNGEATTCAHFDRSWPVMGAPQPDGATGKWRNKLEFILEGNEYAGGSQKVLFQVGSARGGTISIAPSQLSTDFGIDEQPGGTISNLSVAAGLAFGLTCANPSSSIGGAPVVLYDPDPIVFGTSYMFIMQRAEPTPANPNPAWQKLARGDYSLSPPQVSWDGGANKWVIAEGQGIGEKAELTFGITTFSKDKDYLMVFDNPYKNGKDQPSGNVLSVSLPGESISTTISCKYNLQPSVTQPSPDPVSSGEALTVSGGVTNIGPAGGITGNHSWNQYVAKFRQKPSLADMDLPDTSAAFNPCDAIPSSNRYACAKFGGDYTFPAQQNTGNLSYQTDSSDLPGSYICFTTRVNNPTDDSGDDGSWRYTDMKCSVVGKKPKVQIQGGDLKVNGRVSTSISYAKVDGGDTKTFGSWVEYGVFSTGANSIASSGAGLRGGNGNLLTAKKEWSKLTFSNYVSDPATGVYGNYEPTLSNARAMFDDLTVTPGSLNTAVSGVYEVGTRNIGNITIGESAKGRSLIIRGNDITINGPITVNNDNRDSVEEISQIVILADNITIEGDVTNIDAWLLTRDGGSIITCDDVAVSAPLTVGVCDEPLTVTGAVMTSHLYLRRTAGADATSPQSAAEIFRLRPDAQLWAYTYANRGDRAQTTYVTELPPRF